MDAVIRGGIMYLVLLLIFRMYGRRTLGQITTFDFVLLLIISEATQQAMVGQDFSLTNAFLVILTLFALDQILSKIKQKSEAANAILEGVPLVLVDDGRLVKRVMDSLQLDEEDILSAARDSHGISRLDQIRYAVLELNGAISIIPEGKTSSKEAA
jgi:uncharacterized membrane protein YcaP (DUF421 family)